jgi:hypothetical protein
MIPKAFVTDPLGTSRMIVAVESAQNPPMVTPSSARAAINTTKFGAAAITSREASITTVSPISTLRLSTRLAIVGAIKLATTANKPEMEIACPAIPSVAPKSEAIGVSKLTGMNSDAINIATHIDIEPTALQA